MTDLALAVAELAALAESSNPLHQALLNLYQSGELEIVGTRKGQIVWQIPNTENNHG